jgi:anti-anti-sigma factor
MTLRPSRYSVAHSGFRHSAMRASTKTRYANMTPPCVVSFTGEYDLERRPELRKALFPLESCSSVTIDFTGVSYIDASCIGELLKMHGVRRSRGFEQETFIIGERCLIGRVFDIVGLGSTFHIVKTPYGVAAPSAVAV